MTYTTNTKEGASCISMSSTTDFSKWDDHGPILAGPKDGYEFKLWGDHPQGQLESSNLFRKGDKWFLLVQYNSHENSINNWIFESKRMDSFDLTKGREFWSGAYTTEIVTEQGDRSLLASTGSIRFGEVDWSEENPTASFISTPERLSSWGKM